MSDITRSEAIKTLKEHLSHWERLLQEHICEEQEGIDTISALKLAIASLETDEAYQLEYERITKDEVDCNNCKNNFHRGDGTTYCATSDGICHYECEEPTTKNDLAVSNGLENGSPIIDWNNCHTSEQLDSIATTIGVDFKLKDYVSREAVRRIIKSPRTQEQMLNALNSLRNATECKEEDCINRDYTAKYVEEFANNEYVSQDEAETIYLIADGIRHIPSVLPKAEWIPVTEKLPHDRDWYLGIFKEPDTGWINPLPYICDYVGRETKATTKEYWILRGFTDWDDYHIDYYFNLECVAWMPLPKPYEPQESGG